MGVVLHLSPPIEKWLFTPLVEAAGAVGAVGIPGGGMVAGFPTGVGRSGGGGWWPGAFHTRSASIARVGEGHLHLDSFPQSTEARPGLRADLRAGLGEPRADLRAAPRDILRPPPPPPPLRISALANGRI